MADPEEMLSQETPVIGISDWDGSQCRQFKEIPKGSIVLVREGNHGIALVEITSDCFTDTVLKEKYNITDVRNVRVLGWADDYKQPRSGLFSQGTFRSNVNPNTEQYQYIDEWYNSL